LEESLTETRVVEAEVKREVEEEDEEVESKLKVNGQSAL
jgi:hypothetical protein